MNRFSSKMDGMFEVKLVSNPHPILNFMLTIFFFGMTLALCIYTFTTPNCEHVSSYGTVPVKECGKLLASFSCKSSSEFGNVTETFDSNTCVSSSSVETFGTWDVTDCSQMLGSFVCTGDIPGTKTTTEQAFSSETCVSKSPVATFGTWDVTECSDMLGSFVCNGELPGTNQTAEQSFTSETCVPKSPVATYGTWNVTDCSLMLGSVACTGYVPFSKVVEAATANYTNKTKVFHTLVSEYTEGSFSSTACPTTDSTIDIKGTFPVGPICDTLRPGHTCQTYDFHLGGTGWMKTLGNPCAKSPFDPLSGYQKSDWGCIGTKVASVQWKTCKGEKNIDVEWQKCKGEKNIDVEWKTCKGEKNLNVTWETCTGFYETEICASLYGQVGSMVAYVSAGFSFLSAVYTFSAKYGRKVDNSIDLELGVFPTHLIKTQVNPLNSVEENKTKKLTTKKSFQTLYDANSGNHYYYNEEDGETVWDEPQDAEIIEEHSET
jgi:hypothetical protein